MSRRIYSRKHPGVCARDAVSGERTFYIRFTLKGKRRVEEKVGTRSEGYSWALASKVLASRVAPRRHDEELPRDRANDPTWNVMAAAFLEWSETNKRSFADDKQRWEKYLQPVIGHLQSFEATPQHFERVKRRMIQEELAASTIRNVLTLASGIWRRCRDWGLVHGDSPTVKVSAPRINNQRVRFLSPQEVEVFLAELRKDNERDYGLALLAWCTGCRSGEAFGLKWADVDLAQRVATFRDTKTGVTRSVRLNERVSVYLASIGPGMPNEYVWPQRREKGNAKIGHINSTAIMRVANRLFNDGVTDRRHRVVYHTLRHSFASHLVSQGVPLNVVQKLLGHNSLAMVQRYAHLAPGAESNAVELIS